MKIKLDGVAIDRNSFRGICSVNNCRSTGFVYTVYFDVFIEENDNEFKTLEVPTDPKCSDCQRRDFRELDSWYSSFTKVEVADLIHSNYIIRKLAKKIKKTSNFC